MTPDEVKAQYESAAKTYTQQEQRQAAHILVAVKPDATEAERSAAKKKAEDIAAQAKANPAKFAELAKQFSQDPGSAAQGGDLGSNPRGTMMKAFDDAVFAMKPGEIVGTVQTEFGWHVIRLDDVTPARVRPFDEVKAQIETDLKRQNTAQKFAAAADQFQNLVYEQADSLAPWRKRLVSRSRRRRWSRGASRSRSRWAARSSSRRSFLRIDRREAQYGRHRDGPERADGCASGRIQTGCPAAFDDVKDEIRASSRVRAGSSWRRRRGGKSSRSSSRERATGTWGGVFEGRAALAESRAAGVYGGCHDEVFQVDATKLPRYVGAPSERGGFAIYKLVNVVNAA